MLSSRTPARPADDQACRPRAGHTHRRYGGGPDRQAVAYVRCVYVHAALRYVHCGTEQHVAVGAPSLRAVRADGAAESVWESGLTVDWWWGKVCAA